MSLVLFEERRDSELEKFASSNTAHHTVGGKPEISNLVVVLNHLVPLAEPKFLQPDNLQGSHQV